jgi:hypothetical protein
MQRCQRNGLCDVPSITENTEFLLADVVPCRPKRTKTQRVSQTFVSPFLASQLGCRQISSPSPLFSSSIAAIRKNASTTHFHHHCLLYSDRYFKTDGLIDIDSDCPTTRGSASGR